MAQDASPKLHKLEQFCVKISEPDSLSETTDECWEALQSADSPETGFGKYKEVSLEAKECAFVSLLRRRENEFEECQRLRPFGPSKWSQS